MSARTWIRGLLLIIVVLHAALGVWALVAPQSFYDDGPLPGLGWVALLPPYNEHLLIDFGGLNLALVAVIGYAAVRMDRGIVRAGMVGYLLFTVPHAIFHTVHLEHFTPGEAVAQTIGLVGSVIAPIVIIVLAGRLEHQEHGAAVQHGTD
jgi:hypothetical protein